ncbi:hypothetical protein Bca52824_003906 [Brassica carinata]|uniref:Uncharacterized protein n=1 Tax=Brassica carinata TaxID=52824 RepID=A0A8X7WMX4_BRACI|nr:hypothetical protein Bca52824_003906 [Brassica carinata]
MDLERAKTKSLMMVSFWQYHLGRGHIGITMKAQLYRIVGATSSRVVIIVPSDYNSTISRVRYFVIPLWRGNGYVTMFAQGFCNHASPLALASCNHASPLALASCNHASPLALASCNHASPLSFQRQKTWCLSEEAKWIMETARSFYLNNTRYKLLERFNKHTHEFEFKDVLQALDMPIL